MKKHLKASLQQDLDQEEQELLTSFEKGEWKTVKGIAKEKARAQKTATLYHGSAFNAD